ncbi:hypothetical protein ASE63_11575 [Bosea sp. Root381]|uniref:G1 family glutamic endopeptidase n=1 Tax=Bosea sp. Root381 TaxID=1736524 RepID=UPI0007147408|nr:G1 family glutamic endopeptidase [Bosea sp. Root381]KRD96327.1 hypothetical protein ASE63_11575 [Bosea sp. Root381]
MTAGQHGARSGTATSRVIRIETFGVPDADFEPARASDSELERFGLPTRKAMRANPLAAAFRDAFLQRPASGRPLRFRAALPWPVAPAPAPITRGVAAIASQPAQKSANWSGGYVTPRDGQSFASVMGRWRVPTVSVPLGGSEPEYRSSTWIGLDGQRFYLDASLPQIGTKQQCWPGSPRRQRYRTWFQWWARGQATEEQPLRLAICPGDEVSAVITVFDETSVICNLKNETRGLMLEAFRAFAPGPCRISGATAEWIMERPSPDGADGWDAFPLPVFTPFAFTGCIAESQAWGSTALQDRDLEGARSIRMYEIVPHPTQVRTISTAHRVLLPVQKLELEYVSP